VDLEQRSVQAGALTAPFRSTTTRGGGLLEGLDDIGITLSHADDIAAYEATRAVPETGDAVGLPDPQSRARIAEFS
jgi:3-isopropylmalate dehydratase small subunit